MYILATGVFRSGCEGLNWAVPAETFPRFIRLLLLPSYTYSLTLGLAISVGGLTESLVNIVWTDILLPSINFRKIFHWNYDFLKFYYCTAAYLYSRHSKNWNFINPNNVIQQMDLFSKNLSVKGLMFMVVIEKPCDVYFRLRSHQRLSWPSCTVSPTILHTSRSLRRS